MRQSIEILDLTPVGALAAQGHTLADISRLPEEQMPALVETALDVLAD